MLRHTLRTAGAATLALSIVSSVPALAKSTAPVTVRVEGKTQTLLAAKPAHIRAGWIRQGGIARGLCPSQSAQGALDVATHHHWVGKFSPRHGSYEISSILGQAVNNRGTIWKLFVNGSAATAGACKVVPHPGAQLLFAAVPAHRAEYPLALALPGTVSAGRSFTGKVVYYGSNGKAHPLAGATVSVNGHSFPTGANGTLPLKTSQPGTYRFYATDPGYIRAAAVTVHVT